ncbi:flippase [Collimonas sp.]|jgi:O-antigen/teichoic acid export membrane protein|uniref:flippase n=1 Tax=Collimonas sp. TaxID=1963772 RepID=UPI002BA9529A|nr:flippase [Collimonas sp.]HWW04946.1 flippase [Collimonas sp.]
MLIRNTFYNLLGLGLPLLVAIGSMPVLIHHLGDARFGVLTLIWAVVSYFGLFDLGLGRALTQQLSVLIAEKREDDIPPLAYTSLLLLTGLGVFAGVLMWWGATWGAHRISYSGDITEIVGSIRVMAVAMPFIVLTSGLRGILEAKLAFGIINLIRLPMGIFTFIGPVMVVLWYKNDLVAITAVLTVGRIIACLVHGYYAARSLPGMFGNRRYRPELVKTLLVSGGWMTVSNIVSPLMGYLDRFLIGATISAAAVAYYVTPNEMLTKLWIIPGALTAVLFPRFASNLIENSQDSALLFKKAVLTLLLVIYPLTLFTDVYAKEILQIWINPTFAEKSYVLMQIFSFGILINCLAHIPFTLIQGAGKAKTTAFIHTAELPFFALVLWLCATHFGLIGAAFAWLVRILIDTVIMFVQAGKIIDVRRTVNQPQILIFLFAFVTLSFSIGYISSEFIKAALFLVSNVILFSYSWRFLVDRNERISIIAKVSSKLHFYGVK